MSCFLSVRSLSPAVGLIEVNVSYYKARILEVMPKSWLDNVLLIWLNSDCMIMLVFIGIQISANYSYVPYISRLKLYVANQNSECCMHCIFWGFSVIFYQNKYTLFFPSFNN